MRNLASTYQTDVARSPIAELLDMIANKAPQFMRCGGGRIQGDEPNYSRPVPPEVKARFVAMAAEGKDLHEIAKATGFGYSTVCNHTRHLRR